MAPGDLDLLLEQIKIVEQPFGGGGNAPARIYRDGRPVERAQHLLVSGQPVEQLIGTMPGPHAVGGREGLGMARELLDAEQLGAQRRFAHAWAKASIHPVLPA